jgi:negative regulator of flagellin synthesis FlgM
MKISDPQATATIVKLTQNRAADKQTQAPLPSDSSDRVSLSPQARELLAARCALAAIPDIREEKVAEIKARIEAGRYRLDSQAIAAEMIRQSLIEDE